MIDSFVGIAIQTDPWLFFGGLIFLVLFMIFSLSYAFFGDNVFFRILERWVKGSTTTYYALSAYFVLVNYWNRIMAGTINPLIFIAFPVGLLSLTTLYRRSAWLSRYTIMLAIGNAMGLALVGAFESDFIGQIRGLAAMSPYSFDNLTYVFAALTCLSLFLFSVNIKNENRSLNILFKIGRLMLMFYLGANLANAISYRVSWMMNQFQLIFWEWLGMKPYTLPI